MRDLANMDKVEFCRPIRSIFIGSVKRRVTEHYRGEG